MTHHSTKLSFKDLTKTKTKANTQMKTKKKTRPRLRYRPTQVHGQEELAIKYKNNNMTEKMSQDVN